MPDKSAYPPVPEFDHEMGVTRRLLERVPSDKGDWKPHPKSFQLAHLAQLVAGMPMWTVAMLQQPHIDLAASDGYSVQDTQTLLAQFDAGVKAAHDALASASEESLEEEWRLMRGDMELMKDKRGAVVRMHMLHMAHHRAQLGVYLRLLDVPLPSSYGPTADEKW